MILLFVSLMGGAGAVARFLLDAFIGQRGRHRIPHGTAFINVLGSFLLGFISGWWASHGGDEALRMALGVGFCGGFTTFSTASVESARLLRGEGFGASALYACGILVGSLLLAWAGIVLGSAL